MNRIATYLLLLAGLFTGTGAGTAAPAVSASNAASAAGPKELAARTPQLVRLTTEGLTDPWAIDTTVPHFAWQLRSPRQGDAQRSYRIEVASDSLLLSRGEADLWDSGTVRSDRSVGIAYEGRPLAARQLAWWRVTVRTARGGRKATSPIARFGIGLTDTRSPASASV